MVYLEMAAAVERAAPDRLGEVAVAINTAFLAGGLSDDEYEQLDCVSACNFDPLRWGIGVQF